MSSYSELQPVLGFDSWERKALNEDFENDYFTTFLNDFSHSISKVEGDEINQHTQVTDTFSNISSNQDSDYDVFNEQKIAEAEVIPHYYAEDRIVQPGFYLRLPQVYQNTVRSFSPSRSNQTEEYSMYHEVDRVISEENSNSSLEVSKDTSNILDRIYPRPPMSFQFLIVLAIKSDIYKKCTTKDVYKFISGNFPFYRTAGKGWQNCVRHTLSTFKNRTLVIVDKGLSKGYHWSINPKKAEETNKNLIKAWNKDVKRMKDSTLNPSFIQGLVNASASKTTVVSQDLPRPSISLEDQLYQQEFEPWFVEDPFSFTLEEQETSLMDQKSLPVDHSLLPAPYSFVVEQEMPLMKQSSLVAAEKSYSVMLGTEVYPETSVTDHKSAQEAQEIYSVTQDSSETSLVFSKKRKRQFSQEKNNTPAKPRAKKPRLNENNGRLHEKPGLGYTHLITIALKNSPTDSLEVKEIYNFISLNFPYFDINEPAGWKNSLRHALSCQKQHFRSWENPIPQDSKGKHSRLYSFRQEMRQKLIQLAQNACLLKEDQLKKAMANPEDLWNLI